MSDFDKEAERERLREKYERDRQRRDATEQMSELLLKGATMTNAHCSDCGDPVFRYEGQEFCATCEKPVDRDTGGEDTDQQTDQHDEDEDEETGRAVEVTTPSDDGRVVFGEDDSDSPDGPDGETPNRGVERDPRDTPQEQSQHDQTTAPENEFGNRQPRAPDDGDRTRGDTPGASVEAAEETLVETLTRFSQRAAATDDPRRAREHLQAAREAAATLAELRR